MDSASVASSIALPLWSTPANTSIPGAATTAARRASVSAVDQGSTL